MLVLSLSLCCSVFVAFIHRSYSYMQCVHANAGGGMKPWQWIRLRTVEKNGKIFVHFGGAQNFDGFIFSLASYRIRFDCWRISSLSLCSLIRLCLTLAPPTIHTPFHICISGVEKRKKSKNSVLLDKMSGDNIRIILYSYVDLPGYMQRHIFIYIDIWRGKNVMSLLRHADKLENIGRDSVA